MHLPPALKHATYRSYLAGSFVSNVGNSIQAWAIAWQVFALTQSSLMVGLLGLARVGPLLVFALFGGVIADRADRRKVLLVTQAAMAGISLALFATATAGIQSVAPLYLLVALNAVARAFDGPTRQALQVSLVPIKDFPNAASLNGVAWRLSDVLGPVSAGLLIASHGFLGLNGLSLAYGLNFLSFFAVFAVIWRLGPRPAPDVASATSIGDVLRLVGDGLRFVNRTPVVRHAMWVDFWATFFSGAEALLPAFATVVLGLESKGYGILAASSAMGALLAASSLAWLPTIRNQGRWVVAMIALFGLATIGFGLAPNLPVACACLACVGAADMVSTVMRQTIRQLATPDELRGRMSATSSLFHISGPQLGDFEAGAVASWVGERASIVIGGFMCMVVAGLWSRAKALVEYEHEPGETTGGAGQSRPAPPA
ncbi:MAG: MFS transporter [Fimbriimonadaceae bacterium]|nr:MFS transporter [Fimbriimonadaceae bacterium]QYK57144.1 MAG: MFS transporter [Fimbriimonadaceae bacterium]